MRTKYEVVISWSDEDHVFVAEIPGLSGCLAHGKTREQALASIQTAMDLWIDVARASGRQLPKPRTLPASRV